MDFPISDLMDEDACYAKLVGCIHPDGPGLSAVRGTRRQVTTLATVLLALQALTGVGASCSQQSSSSWPHGMHEVAENYRTTVPDTFPFPGTDIPIQAREAVRPGSLVTQMEKTIDQARLYSSDSCFHRQISSSPHRASGSLLSRAFPRLAPR